jgi:Uncharacterized conserved protein
VIIALIIIAVLVVAVLAWAIGTYNGLIKLRNLVQEAWRQIDVELTRRHDLIGNLVETVKGYAAHERGTLEDVMRARSAAMAPGQSPAAQAQSEGMLTQALGRLIAVAEAYPDLKANQNFLALQNELSSTEDRIASARRYYNANVRELNTKVETVPSNIIAGMFNVGREEYFEAVGEQREAPRVDFGQRDSDIPPPSSYTGHRGHPGGTSVSDGTAAVPAPLTPPDQVLTLEAPAAPAPVVATQAPKMAPQVQAEAIPGLDARVDTFMDALTKAAPRSPEFAQQADNVRTMGDADIRKAAETSNRLLQTPVKALKEGGIAQGSAVGKTLLELRRTVEDLDPSAVTGGRKILGIIPFGDKVVDYFRRYQSAQSQLNAILHSLRNGQDELTRDNVALNLEKTNLWAAMGRLNQYVYIAERLDTRLAARIAELELTDPEGAKALQQDVLFYVRQKHQDLLTQLAVSIQSYLAIDVIIKNNIELIKGVDRASTTTVSALRTAVIVAQALGNQKLVLEQITALNTTTSGMIQRTSEMLKDNSAAIQEQAASSTIGMAELQAAFQNIYATMDSIDTFKVKALDTMAQTIGVLETEVEKSKDYLARVHAQDARGTQTINLDQPGA